MVLIECSFFERFVENLLLYKWDWIAVIISICAAVIAFFTLKSQVQTQKNTNPIVSTTVQFTLLTVLIEQIVKTMAINYALRSRCIMKNGIIRPEKYVLHWLTLDQSFVHEELYYSEPIKFEAAHILRMKIEDYNYYVETIISDLDKVGFNEDCFKKNKMLLEEVARKLDVVLTELTRGNKKVTKEILLQQARERVIFRFQEWNSVKHIIKDLKIEKGANFKNFALPLSAMFTQVERKEVFENMDAGILFYLNKLIPIEERKAQS